MPLIIFTNFYHGISILLTFENHVTIYWQNIILKKFLFNADSEEEMICCECKASQLSFESMILFVAHSLGQRMNVRSTSFKNICTVTAFLFQ